MLCTGLSLDGGMPVTARGIKELSPLDGGSTFISQAMSFIRIVIVTGASAVAVIKSVIVVSNFLDVVTKKDFADQSTTPLVPVDFCHCTAALLLLLYSCYCIICNPQDELSI